MKRLIFVIGSSGCYQVVHVLDKVGIQERWILDHRWVGASNQLEARLVLMHTVQHGLNDVINY